jgi:hypothetical protein
MTPITYISEQDRDYVKSLKAARTVDALKSHVTAWKQLASDAYEQTTAASFNFDDFRQGRLKENRNQYAGDEWAMKYGAILMPEILIRVAIIAQQFGVPWGCAYIRLKEAKQIDDSNGTTKWIGAS